MGIFLSFHQDGANIIAIVVEISTITCFDSLLSSYSTHPYDHVL